MVLGAGGITGIAWHLGLLIGLREAGVDVTDADLIVGTSAGSVAGALIDVAATADRIVVLAPLAPARPRGVPAAEITAQGRRLAPEVAAVWSR